MAETLGKCSKRARTCSERSIPHAECGIAIVDVLGTCIGPTAIVLAEISGNQRGQISAN